MSKKKVVKKVAVKKSVKKVLVKAPAELTRGAYYAQIALDAYNYIKASGVSTYSDVQVSHITRPEGDETEVSINLYNEGNRRS